MKIAPIYQEILKEAAGAVTDAEIIDAIKNNLVVELIYNYDHWKDGKRRRYGKAARVYVLGNTIGKTGQKMIRIFEKEGHDYAEPKMGIRGIRSITTTESNKWKTVFVDQIDRWEVVDTEKEDFPSYLNIPYKRNDKLFRTIQYQK